MEQYNVKIDAFEGPLDLLLHLINRLEIDIYDINVTEITEQYLFYVHAMQELQLDVASEYLVMAATLLAIKSKMLLPKHEEEEFDELEVIEYEEEATTMEELVTKLVEYKKYKEAAIEFKSLEQEQALVYTKPPMDLSDYIKDVKVDSVNLDVNIYDMIGALQKMIRRQKMNKPLTTKIARQEIPIEKKMTDILDQLRFVRGRVKFEELFTAYTKEEVVVTFLAILELLKQQEITLTQEKNFEQIFILAAQGEGLKDE